MNFGKTIEHLKCGSGVYREGWNGKDMHVVLSKLYTPNNIQVNNDCLLLFNTNKRYNTWVPSITDLFADGWETIK